MFSRISCEFEMVEFAESAAKRIEDTVDGPKKIRIIPKRNKYKSSYNSNEIPSENNELFVLLPAAVTSYNYITGQITRPVDKSKYKESMIPYIIGIVMLVASVNILNILYKIFFNIY